MISAQLNITTAYNTGATISLGVTGATGAFMATTDNNPQYATVPTIFQVDQDTTVTPSAAVLATVTGATGGAANVIIRYVATPQS